MISIPFYAFINESVQKRWQLASVIQFRQKLRIVNLFHANHYLNEAEERYIPRHLNDNRIN